MTKATRVDLIQLLVDLNLSNNIDINNLVDDITLDKQGLDSLDMMNFLFQLEETFRVKIDEDSQQENEWRSINDILKRINEE